VEVTNNGNNTTITKNTKTTFAINERVGMRFTMTDPDKIEAYAFDYKDNKSATATATFTVK
jgi:acyl-homoserine lactone acylase PvdQ